jgi:hypothetical protein
MKNSYLLLFSLLLLTCCNQHRKVKKLNTATFRKIEVTRTDTTKIFIKEPDLRELVSKLNDYLIENDSISPSQYYDPRKFKLTKNEVDSLLREADNEEKDKVSGYTLNTYVQAHADILLNKVLNHKAIVKYNLTDILGSGVIASPDGKLFNFIYNANTGGTYQNRVSYIHYRPGDGSVFNFSGEGTADSLCFNQDGFGSIDTITTKEGVKYLLVGSVIGCGTCIGEYIQLVHFTKGKPVFDFSYSLNSRTGDEGMGITYDNKRKIIMVEHQPEKGDSISSDCSCNTDEPNAIDISSGLKEGKQLKCVFYFNGHTFILNRKLSRMPK